MTPQTPKLLLTKDTIKFTCNTPVIKHQLTVLYCSKSSSSKVKLNKGNITVASGVSPDWVRQELLFHIYLKIQGNGSRRKLFWRALGIRLALCGSQPISSQKEKQRSFQKFRGSLFCDGSDSLSDCHDSFSFTIYFQEWIFGGKECVI